MTRRCSGAPSAGCCACRRRSTCAISARRASASAERLARLRELLRRGRFDFDEAVRGADRMTVAVTLFALLELYKRGEAHWEQDAPFAPIAVCAGAPGADGGVRRVGHRARRRRRRPSGARLMRAGGEVRR